jgi:hypothetical protein
MFFVFPIGQDCGGCADMHLGIANFIAKNGGTDEQVAQACGVSMAIVRQAKVRHILLLEFGFSWSMTIPWSVRGLPY